MKFEYKYPVKVASLHQAIQIHGVVFTEKTLSETKTPGLKSFWTDKGLLLIYKDTVALIPHCNVQVVTLEGENAE